MQKFNRGDIVEAVEIISYENKVLFHRGERMVVNKYHELHGCITVGDNRDLGIPLNKVRYVGKSNVIYVDFSQKKASSYSTPINGGKVIYVDFKNKRRVAA